MVQSRKSRLKIVHFNSDRNLAKRLSKALEGERNDAELFQITKGKTPAGIQLSNLIRSISGATCFFVIVIGPNWSEAPCKTELIRVALAEWRGDNLAFLRIGKTDIPVGTGDLTLDLPDPHDLQAIAMIAQQLGKAAAQLRVPIRLDPVVRLKREISSENVAAGAEFRDVLGMRRNRRRLWLASSLLTISLLGLATAPFVFFSDVIDDETPFIVFRDNLAVLGFAALAAALLTFVIRSVFWIGNQLRLAASRQRLRSRVKAAEREEKKDTEVHYDVFISYSRKDDFIVSSLHDALTDSGLRVWRDVSAPPPTIGAVSRVDASARFGRRIVEAISQSRIVVVMGSASAFTSHHVLREIYVAGGREKPFVWVRLDASELPGDFEYYLAGFPRLPQSGTPPPLAEEFAAAFKGVYRID